MKRTSRKLDGPVRMSIEGRGGPVNNENRRRGSSIETGASKLPVISRPSSQSHGGMRRSNSAVDRKSLAAPTRSSSSTRTPMSVRSLSANRSTEKNRMDFMTPVRGLPSSSRKSTISGMKASNRLSGRGSAIGAKDKGIKDTRPLGDKSFQQASVRRILDFLREQGYHNAGLTSKHFPLSGKEFTEIFNFLYSVINPSITEVLPYSRSEEKIINVLKNELKYPGQITKSNLVTMGSLHSWPTVLGCLSFMTTKARIHMKIEENMDAIAFPSFDDQGFPDGNESLGKVRLEHQAACYARFDEGYDTFPEEMDLFRQRLDHMFGVDQEQMCALEEEYRREKAMKEELTAKTQEQQHRMRELKEQQKKKEDDKEKLAEYVQAMIRKKKGYMKEEEHLQGLLVDLQEQDKAKKEILDNLAQKKAASGLMMSGMNAQLEVEKRRRILQTEDQMKVLKDEKWQLEIQFYGVVEKLERVARAFNSGCIELQLRTGEEFTTLPLPDMNGGVVTREGSIPGLRGHLADLLRDQKARKEAQLEELNRLMGHLGTGGDNLKAAQHTRTQRQSMLGELEAGLFETKERVEREEAALDKSIADLKSQLMQLRSGAQEERDQLIEQIETKRERLERLVEFNARRKVEGEQFLAAACKKSVKHIEDMQAALLKAKEKVKVWTTAKAEATRKAHEELNAIDAEIKQMVSSALE